MQTRRYSRPFQVQPGLINSSRMPNAQWRRYDQSMCDTHAFYVYACVCMYVVCMHLHDAGRSTLRQEVLTPLLEREIETNQLITRGISNLSRESPGVSRVSRKFLANDNSMNQTVARISFYDEHSQKDPTISGGITFRSHISPSNQVPCARGGSGNTSVRRTLTMEHHDVCRMMMIEGGPRLIPEFDRCHVYHRDGFSSIPSTRCRPRFRVAPISARQHLIHTVTTLSHPQF